MEDIPNESTTESKKENYVGTSSEVSAAINIDNSLFKFTDIERYPLNLECDINEFQARFFDQKSQI
jgi:hypothetical protein